MPPGTPELGLLLVLLLVLVPLVLVCGCTYARVPVSLQTEQANESSQYAMAWQHTRAETKKKARGMQSPHNTMQWHHITQAQHNCTSNGQTPTTTQKHHITAAQCGQDNNARQHINAIHHSNEIHQFASSTRTRHIIAAQQQSGTVALTGCRGSIPAQHIPTVPRQRT